MVSFGAVTNSAAWECFALREETIGRRARCRDMCEQCKEIDAKIEHYQRVAERIADQTTIAGLNKPPTCSGSGRPCIPTTPRMSLRSERLPLNRRNPDLGKQAAG